MIILLGPPGSGKTSQAFLLAKNCNLILLSARQILLDNSSPDSPTGKTIREYLNRGVLVPNELIIPIMDKEIKMKCVENKGFILEGYPVTLPQAESLNGSLGEQYNLWAVVEMKFDDETIIKRMAYREMCSNCQWNFNSLLLPSKQAGVCDKCGSSITKRLEDDENVARKRLAQFYKDSLPVIKFFQSKSYFRSIDAMRPFDDVTQQLMSFIVKQS